MNQPYSKLVILFTTLSFMLTPISAQIDNPNFDEKLAAQYQADEYGMKKYFLVILKTGPNLSEDKAFRDSCFVGHMTNIKRLVEEHKLVVAGPLGKNELAYRGIFIFNVESLAELHEMLLTDPAINEKLLDTEIISWYGSAALPAYLEDADKAWRVKP
jgi:uncharacterized protein